MSATQIKAVFPKLLVRSGPNSLAYDGDALGFRVSNSVGEPAMFGIVERDGRGIHLKQGEPRTRRAEEEAWDVYFEVRGVDALHREMLGNAAHIVRSPVRVPY